MFDPLAMIIADKATVHHVMSGRPDAPTTPDRRPRQHVHRLRPLVVRTLRRLADRIEPRRVDPCAPAA
jgi:hypothetical protein